MKSQILFHVVRENEVKKKYVKTEEFITDLFIYTITPKHNYLFVKESQVLYKVDHQDKTLLKIDEDTNITSQIKQLKSMFLIMNVKKNILDEVHQEYIIEGKGNSAILNSNVSTVAVKGLELTSNSVFYKNNQKTSLFELNLPNDELVISNSMEMNIQGKRIQTSSKVKNFRFIEENKYQFDYIFQYKSI